MSIRRAPLPFETEWAHVHRDDVPSVVAALYLYGNVQVLEEDAQRIYDLADAMSEAVKQ